MDFKDSILSYTDDDKPNPYGKQTYFKVDSDTERELLDISSKKWGITFRNSNVKNFEVFQTEGHEPMVLINYKAPYLFKGKGYYSFDIPLTAEERQDLIREIDIMRERDIDTFISNTKDDVLDLTKGKDGRK